jgi:hypothetical protein
MNKDSFVYCWTDHKKQKLYVGVHKGTTTDGYVCSSKKMLEEYSIRPNDFSRQIIAEGNYEDMISLETAILRSVNAKLNEDFYNGHNGDGKFYNKGHTEETKKKFIGKIHSEDTRQKLREARLAQPDPRLGKKHTPETIEKMRQAKMGNNAGAGNKGKKRSDESKQKTRETMLKRWAENKENWMNNPKMGRPKNVQ